MRGLHDYLMSREVDREAFHDVPMTAARETLIEDGEGEVEKMIRQYVESRPAEQTCFWFDELVRFAMRRLSDRPKVRDAFEKNARKLLRDGFAGWEYPNKATWYRHPEAGDVICKGVVHRAMTATDARHAAADRWRWLGTGPTGETSEEKLGKLRGAA